MLTVTVLGDPADDARRPSPHGRGSCRSRAGIGVQRPAKPGPDVVAIVRRDRPRAGGRNDLARRDQEQRLPSLVPAEPCLFPPSFSAQRRYPTLYVLHGFRGSPYSIANGLRFATFADDAIVAGQVRPFLAVMPPAGLTARFSGEWTGVWERYVVEDVVPWSDRNLPALRLRAARAIAGLSAGGYGAADIGLRHAALFGTIESWSGYFSAPHDGSLRHASAKQRAANDPTMLAKGEAALLRRLRTRFFLSCGFRDPVTLLRSIQFARVLAALGVRHRTFFAPGRHDGRFWESQLPAALHYAFPETRTGGL